MVRVLWQPLFPQIISFTRSLPLLIRHHPFTALGLALGFSPLFIPLAFTLPFVLIADAILQKIYNNYAAPIEVLYEDGPEMVRLGLRSAALSAKESYRLVKQTVK